MNTQRLVLTGELENDELCFKEAAGFIKRGGNVTFPTETVYGLGANALDAGAVAKIFEAKKRPTWDPLIIHISSLEMFRTLIKSAPPVLDVLINHFMPGPLTVILPKSENVPNETCAGLSSVAIRMPAHPVALRLIELSGTPIAAPSANLFGRTSPTTAAHVLADLDGRIDAILDGGPTDVGIESTVLDLTATIPTIVRPGGITKEQLEGVIGEVILLDPTKPISENEVFAPGMMHKHYAPNATVILTEGTNEALSQTIREVLQAGKKVGVLLPDQWQIPDNVLSVSWGTWRDQKMLSHTLFSGLRFLDQQNIDTIIVPQPDANGLGLAIVDRLRKAAYKSQEAAE